MSGGLAAAVAALVFTAWPGLAGAIAGPPPAPDAGVYKTRFDNALVSGERYRSENILEIVDHSPGTAYVRLHLEFFNGHQCAIWGIAERRAGALVYRTRDGGDDAPCALTVRRSGSKLVLGDAGGVCRQTYCGARGTFDGVSFPVAARRPIRYLPRLKASAEYKAAAAAYAGR